MANKQDQENEKPIEITDLSGGIQEKTTEYLQKPNELDNAINARYDTIGGIKKSRGYVQQNVSDFTSTSSTSTSSSTTTTSTSSSTTTSSSSSTSSSITTTSTSSTSTSTTTS